MDYNCVKAIPASFLNVFEGKSRICERPDGSRNDYHSNCCIICFATAETAKFPLYTSKTNCIYCHFIFHFICYLQDQMYLAV